MSLKSDMAAEAALFLDTDEFADTVVIGGQSVSAIVDYEESPADPISTARAAGRGAVDRAVITVRRADLPQPAYRTAIVAGGTTWYVQTWAGDGIFWELSCNANERVGR